MGRDYERANLATAENTEDSNRLFEGALFTRNAIAEVCEGRRRRPPRRAHPRAGCLRHVR